MPQKILFEKINDFVRNNELDIAGNDKAFYARFIENAPAIFNLYMQLYKNHPETEEHFSQLLHTILRAYKMRDEVLKQRDEEKLHKDEWFLSNDISGMSLYVDRFCGKIKNLSSKLSYLRKLGVNLIHLMPVFQSPADESDGGYAVSDFRKVDPRFGDLNELKALQKEMREKNFYLMLDIVLNHTSHHHEWAVKAKQGDVHYQDYYYVFRDRSVPDLYEQAMPDIFPESSPGNFTYIEECNLWAMTVFHSYQWDLNYRNPRVLVEMLDTIFFYANLGVDVLRVDAPAFIWKQTGTTCQNLPQVHTVLCLLKQCVRVATPGMALLAEAIVAPSEIMNYFGTGDYKANECDLAYNATQMALQWDMLATADTRVMLAAQHELQRKPLGTSWINYTRCHDDIGLGYEDYMIAVAGFSPFEHRKFLKDYYSGKYDGSPASGALFSVNTETSDARISGSLASLCGLEKAIERQDEVAIDHSIRKILLMQSHSFFLGGLPMIFYGDEAGYTNDYSYLSDPGKNYDNRWMHRPIIDWKKNKRINTQGSIENRIFTATQKLLALRRQLPMIADYNNLVWMSSQNIHVAGYIRFTKNTKLYCLFNFHQYQSSLTWFAFKENQHPAPALLYDHWSGNHFQVKSDHEYFTLEPYSFYLLESVDSDKEI